MKKLVAIAIVLLIGFVAYAQILAPSEGLHVPVPGKTSISLSFAGDILAARTVETRMRQKGYDYPFDGVRDELSKADIAFANLETPLIGNRNTGKTTPGGTTSFRGDVDFAEAVHRAGIDVVSLANNHMKDQGEAGIRSTIEVLDKAGVAHAGAGMTLEEARNLTIVEAKGIKVGYLAYNDADVVPASYHAKVAQSGTNIMDIARLKEDVAKARPQVDVLIVSMHSGTEYVTSKPNGRQTAFAYAAVDAGADMVIGHHPHVLQPLEIYKGKYIFYSLGNFVFDQPWPDTKESAIVHADVSLLKRDGTWKVSSIVPAIVPLGMQNFAPYIQKDRANAAKVMRRFSASQNLLTIGSQPIFVELATTSDDRIKGLSNRKNLPKNTGLLFVFDQADNYGIWMKDMLMPIDIFWFDQDFRLVDQKLSVSPLTYPNVFYPKEKALYVLETEPGLLGPMSLTSHLTGELTLLQSYDKR